MTQDTVPDTFRKTLQKLTQLSSVFAQLEDLHVNDMNDVNNSDIAVTYQLMKPLVKNSCSFVSSFRKGRVINKDYFYGIYSQMTAALGTSFNCSQMELQYLQLKLELYYALTDVFGPLLEYDEDLGVTDNIDQKQWIIKNIVCQGNVSRDVLDVITAVFGALQCAK